VLTTLHTECVHLFAKIDVRIKLFFALACDAKITSTLLVQPAEASHNLVPLLPPPPPQLDDEDTKVSAPPLEHNRHTVPDADLDVSVDLGEAVARSPGLTPWSKSRSASPMLPDYLSPVHNATFAPGIGAQRPGECTARHLAPYCYVSHVLNVDSNLYAYVQPPLPPAPLSIMPRRLQRLGLRHASLPRW